MTMSETLSLDAQPRDRAGKGASRGVRRTGWVPAVIYGAKQTPVMISVQEKVLAKMLQKGHFMNSVVEVTVDGAKERTLPRDVQFHPVTDRPIHVDFLRLAADSKVTVMVPVRFVDESDSPALKAGGVLNIVRHEVELLAPSDQIPDELVISCKGLTIGDSVHISAVTLPAGCEPTIKDRDFTIATVVAPSGMRSEADAAAAEDEKK